LPDRWSRSTADAICSGVLYTAVASIQGFVESWLQAFPRGAIGFTGGDSALLVQALKQLKPAVAAHITHDPQLIFHGIPTITGFYGAMCLDQDYFLIKASRSEAFIKK
jgi:type III pantothenate kinase